MVPTDGELVFAPVAAAKLLKGLKLDTERRSGTVEKTPIEVLRRAIETSRQALALGEQIIKNFAAVNAERQRRHAPREKIGPRWMRR